MAEVISLGSNHQLNQHLQDLQSLFNILDSNQISRDSSLKRHPNSLQFDSKKHHQMQRGYMYRAYSELRESKLRQKKIAQINIAQPPPTATPPKKKVSVAQSVPDFSTILRKENKKPNSMLETTPPAGNGKGSLKGVLGGGGGSKSANVVGEKKGGGGVVRKSYASLKELKGFSAVVASAIDEEGRRGGGARSRGVKKTVLGYK